MLAICLIINTAIESRFSALATCKTTDAFLIADVSARALVAGEVWAHLEVSGEPITVVSMWELVTINHDAAYAEWRAINDPWFIETSEILDTVIWDRPRAGIVRMRDWCSLLLAAASTTSGCSGFKSKFADPL